jgi:MerR family transcriptional regulator, heat shock protein HspR
MTLDHGNRREATPSRSVVHIRQELTVEIVAARTGTSVRRVRYLERQGLVSPINEEGSQRLYNEAAVERILLIERLVRDLGVNLPGAEVILNMRDRMLVLMEQLDRSSHS